MGARAFRLYRREDMGKMYVLGRQGDTEWRWDENDPESVEQARQAFGRYVRARCLAFSTPPGPGGEATRVHDFDPKAPEVIITRPLVGG
jgi:hypothetical protein